MRVHTKRSKAQRESVSFRSEKRGKVQRARPQRREERDRERRPFASGTIPFTCWSASIGAVTIRGCVGCGAPLSYFRGSAWERGGARCGTHRCRLGGGPAHRNRLSCPVSCQIRACASVFRFCLSCHMLEAKEKGEVGGAARRAAGDGGVLSPPTTAARAGVDISCDWVKEQL